MYEAKDIIKQLISNKGLRKRIAENAIKTAQKFKSDTLIPQIISVYKKYVKK